MDLIGQKIGNFVLTEVLGVGGMGIVHLAEHVFLPRKKAVKVLRQEAAQSPTLVRRFFDEAMAANACQHDHIVSVEDCGTFEAGGLSHHYLEMELLEGVTVGQAMEPPHSPRGRFEDVERAARVIATAGDALAAAHARSIVHRDVKPENLFLAVRAGRADYVKVLDFGIARLSGSSLAHGMKTRTGSVMGTPEYMSPEQALGQHPEGRSDVYSLGVVLYRMLSGRLPFQAATFPLLAVKIAGEAARPLLSLRPGTPPAVVRAVEESMRKAAGDRPTMRELVELLHDGDAAPRPIAPEASLTSVPGPSIHGYLSRATRPRPAHEPEEPELPAGRRVPTEPGRPSARRRH